MDLRTSAGNARTRTHGISLWICAGGRQPQEATAKSHCSEGEAGREGNQHWEKAELKTDPGDII